MSNLFSIVLNGAKHGLDNKILVYNDICLMYDEFIIRVKKRAEIFKSVGISKCAKVALIFENPYEFILSFFAISYLDAVIMPMYSNTGQKKIEDTIKINDINFIVSSVDLIFKKLYEDPESKYNIYFNSNITDNELLNVRLILLTSGTTNIPKAIMLTEENIFTNMTSISNYLKLSPVDNILLIKNLCHASSLIGELLVGIQNGCTIVLSTKLPIANVILTLIESKNITVFFAVPTILKDIITYKKLGMHNLEKLRIINFYGAPMSQKDILRLVELFPKCNLIYSYGQTEASPRVTYIERKDLVLKPTSSGRAIDGVKFKIVNENDKEVKPFKEGEIIVQGLNVMKGYYRNKDKTLKVLRNGWLHTGDIGYVDENGFLYVKGRRDNMLISFGKNIYLEEIECTLVEMNGVLEVLAEGQVKDNGTVEIYAYIVLDNKNIKVSDIHEYCLKHLENYKIPKKIIIVDELKKTNSRKILRNQFC